jgi:glyoxylase I family protein
MRGTPHHIDLTVHNLERSAPFYASILGFMGYRNERANEWVLASGPVTLSVDLVAAHGPDAARRNDRYSPGLHHLAWRATSRADVDDMYHHLLGIGAAILDPPADYPQYNRGRGYYAVFFADPDGLKLEYVHTPIG